MQKYDLINNFGRGTNSGRYLEICTPSTGNFFASVAEEMFPVRHRLMYRCPEDFDDGLPITFRTPSDDAHDVIRTLLAIQQSQDRYDIILVDPWHTYLASSADILGAIALLHEEGVVIVHDCNPTDPSTVQPVYRDGSWCGVTYQAFIDAALSAHHGGYCTVDCDYGCGIIFGSKRPFPPSLPHGPPTPATLFEWTVACADDRSRYAFFDRNRKTLLNLVTPTHFLDALDFPQPRPAPGKPIETVQTAPPSPDQNLLVKVDQIDILPEAYTDGWHCFAVPSAARNVWIKSPSYIPAENDSAMSDRRRLGVAVAGIRLDGVLIDLADDALCDGWHSEEQAVSYPWRWTDGNGRLRLPDGVSTLDIYTVARREAAETPAPIQGAPPATDGPALESAGHQRPAARRVRSAPPPSPASAAASPHLPM